MDEEKNTKTGGKSKVIFIIVGACVLILAIVGVIIFNVATIKTFECSFKNDYGQGAIMNVHNVQKFRFGEPVNFVSEQVFDFSNSTLDEEEKNERISGIEENAKKQCEKKNGCKFSTKRSGDKYTLVYKTKHTKEGRKDFWEKQSNYIQDEDDDLTYDEYVEWFEEMCKARNASNDN